MQLLKCRQWSSTWRVLLLDLVSLCLCRFVSPTGHAGWLVALGSSEFTQTLGLGGLEPNSAKGVCWVFSEGFERVRNITFSDLQKFGLCDLPLVGAVVTALAMDIVYQHVSYSKAQHHSCMNVCVKKENIQDLQRER